MKNLNITIVLIAIVGLTLSSCSSWRYNNPRVSVDREKTIPLDIRTNSVEELVAIPQGRVSENNLSKINSTPDLRMSRIHSSKADLIVANDKKLPVVANSGNSISKPPFKLFGDHFKKSNSALKKGKSIEMTALSGWVRIMVILFVVGFILLLVGIFLSVFIFGGFWWLFYGFGALLILAGFVILILGLLGLI